MATTWKTTQSGIDTFLTAAASAAVASLREDAIDAGCAWLGAVRLTLTQTITGVSTVKFSARSASQPSRDGEELVFPADSWTIETNSAMDKTAGVVEVKFASLAYPTTRYLRHIVSSSDAVALSDALTGSDPLAVAVRATVNSITDPDPVSSVDLRYSPFAATSPWNSPIPSGSTFAADSDPRTAQWKTGGYTMACNYQQWTQWAWYANSGMSSYTFDVSPTYIGASANASDGAVTIKMDPATMHPDPAYYTGTLGGDMWGDRTDGDFSMCVMDPDNLHCHEFWQARRSSGGSYRAVAYAKVKLNNSGVIITNNSTVHVGIAAGVVADAKGWGAGRAYGGSELGGLIRAGEVTAGPINHALAIAVPGSWINTSIVYPGSKQQYGYPSAGLYYSTRLAIRPSVNVNALAIPDTHKRLARAFQVYGGYIVDQAGGVNLYVDGVAASADGAALNGNSAAMGVIQNLLTAVD